DRAGRDAGYTAWRLVPVLQAAVPGGGAGRAGAGFAVWPEPAGFRAVLAFRPGDPVRATGAADVRFARAGDQRGGVGQHAGSQRRRLRAPDEPDPDRLLSGTILQSDETSAR